MFTRRTHNKNMDAVRQRRAEVKQQRAGELGRLIADSCTHTPSTEQQIPTEALADPAKRRAARKNYLQQRKRGDEKRHKFSDRNVQEEVRMAIDKRQRQKEYRATLTDLNFRKRKSNMKGAGIGIILLEPAARGTHVMMMEGSFTENIHKWSHQTCERTTYRDKTLRTKFNSEADLHTRQGKKLFIAPGDTTPNHTRTTHTRYQHRRPPTPTQARWRSARCGLT